MNFERPVLMIVTDASVPDLAARLDDAIAGGAAMVRIRPAGPWGDADTALLDRLKERHPGTLVVAAHDAPAAAMERADGVHLPEREPMCDRLRSRPGFLVGRSVHPGPYRPEPGLDYGLFGTVFASATHPGGPVAGLGALRAACEELAPLPVLAIGGVTAANAGACVAAGASGVAVIRSVLMAGDPAGAAAEIVRAMGEAR